MDGLECSEIKISALELTKRIDSEYYRKLFLDYDTCVQSIPNKLLGCISNFLIGPFGSAYNTDNYVETSPYRYVRGQDVKPFVLKDIEPKYIAENDYARLSKYALKEKDILVSVVGTLGNACIVRDRDIPAIFSCKSTVIRTTVLSPEYLVTYLNCKYGRQLLLRKERGAIQKGLNLDDLKSLLVPLFSDKLDCAIGGVITLADTKLDSSKKIYVEAEQLLLSALGMTNFAPTEHPVSVKSISESFVKSGRLDAEYYQPKYDKLFDVLSKCQTKPLGGILGVVDIKKSIEPGSSLYQSEGIPFIRVSDVTKFGISEPEIHLPVDVVPNALDLCPQKDTILFSKDGSVGIAYKIEHDSQLITSGALLHLTVRNKAEVLPGYLTLVLNSIVVQLQAERDSSGAIIQHWKPSEVEKVVIPILDMDIQREISSKVQESFALRQQSEQLLENAKRAVEIAIEQGERKAVEWLQDKVVM